jgi:hypothetical protein
MHPTGLPIFPAPAASSTRRTAAGVKADRRSPAGLGLDASEDRRTLTLAGATTQITCIMSMSVRSFRPECCASLSQRLDALQEFVKTRFG